MTITVTPPTDKKVHTSLTLTASKSESNRALIIRALAEQQFEIRNLAAAKDTETLDRLLREMPARADVGPAGTTFRFLTAYLATRPQQTFTLTGSERMQQRPVGILVDALRSIGADIEYLAEEGYPPLRITGKELRGGKVKMDGSVSSQFISALLLIAPTLADGLELELLGEVTSRPYLEMTLRMMEHFGAQPIWKDATISVPATGYQAQDFTVEADWSAASYWYSIVALADEAEVELKGLRSESLQGDAACEEIYAQLGVQTTYNDTGIVLRKEQGATLPSLTYDFGGCPDIAQTVVCTMAALGGAADFTGLHTLDIKETRRRVALRDELAHFGHQVTLVEDDRLQLSSAAGESTSETIKTYHDHRMAMSFAPMALVYGPLEIADPDVVNKSYPDFWKDLETAGFQVQ